MCFAPYIRTNMLVNRERLGFQDQAAFFMNVFIACTKKYRIAGVFPA